MLSARLGCLYSVPFHGPSPFPRLGIFTADASPDSSVSRSPWLALSHLSGLKSKVSSQATSWALRNNSRAHTTHSSITCLPSPQHRPAEVSHLRQQNATDLLRQQKCVPKPRHGRRLSPGVSPWLADDRPRLPPHSILPPSAHPGPRYLQEHQSACTGSALMASAYLDAHFPDPSSKSSHIPPARGRSSP